VILNSILTAEPKLLNEVNPLIPAEVAAMVQKMIQKEPAQRFQHNRRAARRARET